MDKSEEGKEAQREAKPSWAGVPEFYGSSVHISVGPYEVVVDVGSREPDSDSPTPVFRQRMSLQFAWVYCAILQRTLDMYVRDNGPITLPKNLLEQLYLTEQYQRQSELYRETEDEQ